MWSRKHTVAGLVFLGALLAGGSTLFAAGGAPASSGGPFWAGVAAKLGVPTGQLTAAIQATQTANMEAKAAAKHWTSAQISQAEARIQNEHLGPPSVRHPAPPLKVAAVIDIAAQALHLKPAQLVADLHQDSTLSAVATKLGVNPATLQQSIDATLQSRLETEVQSGHLKAQREAAILQHREQVVAKWMTRDFSHFHLASLVSVVIRRSATFLGMTPKALRQELSQGSTLAQVAQQHEKTSDKLVAAIVAPRAAALQKAEAAGHISSATETARLNAYQNRVTQIVGRVFHFKNA